MNTACQLNYVISVAYGYVEYKKNLENVENKWYNTVKVFVYGVTGMDKEKYLVLIEGKDKTEEIEKLEQTEKYYIIRFYNANKTYKYNYSKVVIENTTQQIEVKDNQIVMIDNIIISNVTKIIKYISKIRIIFSDSREKLTGINKIKLLENNNKSSEEEILNYFKELSKYVKIVDEKTGEERYLLEKQYNKFTIPEKSVLKYYLNGINTEGQLKEKVNIYPFNFNISQKQAVENVNKSNISVIKGPPAPGNHMRVLNNMVERGNYNQRELEMLKKEIAEGELLKDVNKNDIGFTTPYRKQAEKAAMQNKEIESKTVHKYQGKEKKVMILSTVLDNSNAGKRRMNFVDDPCLVNVAVSRAEEQFILITNEKLFSEQSNEIKALIQYIKYNSLDKNIINSQIVSVFDLLYNEYSPRLKWLESKLVHTSKYKSENIIETVLIEVLKTEKSKGLSYCSQMYLKNIFKDLSRLTEEERRYVNNNASVDFIIYENDRTPKFCIEVDGFAFHANNPKQLVKDRMKDSIFRKYGLDLIRLNTDEGGNIEKIKEEIEK